MSQTPSGTGKGFCGRCGQPLRVSDAFCPGCGMTVPFRGQLLGASLHPAPSPSAAFPMALARTQPPAQPARETAESHKIPPVPSSPLDFSGKPPAGAQPGPVERPADPASRPDMPIPPPAAEPRRAGRKIPPVVWAVGAAGVLFALLVLAGIVAAIAIPSMLQANREARQAAVQELLRSLASSERVYASQSGGGAYGTLGEMAARGFVDSSLAVEPVRAHGYRIRAEWVERRTFCFSATPEDKGDTPYFIDHTMTVYEGYPSARETRGAKEP